MNTLDSVQFNQLLDLICRMGQKGTSEGFFLWIYFSLLPFWCRTEALGFYGGFEEFEKKLDF